MEKKIFSENENYLKNAFLNWRTDANDVSSNFFMFAQSFSNASKLLIKAILDDNTDNKSDSLIFPIFYSINQAIELYLKAIMGKIDMLNGNHSKTRIDHKPRKLFDDTLKMIKNEQGLDNGLDELMEPVKDYVDELSNVMGLTERGYPKIDFARYPTDTSGNNHFYVRENFSHTPPFTKEMMDMLNKHVVVDVENLGVVFEKIINCLELLYGRVKKKLEIKR